MNIKKMLIILTLCCVPIACSNGDKTKSAATNTKAETATATNDQNLECLHITETYCTSCHQQSRICKKLGKKNLGQWDRTIKRMVKHGAKLSTSQKDALTECLANQSDSITRACE